jgi:hypothetical protein
MDGFQLAQINVGRLRAPVDSPDVAEFIEALDPINALADASPGFVWRFQTEEGNATAVRPYADDSILVNLSVWESVDALAAFVYHSAHAGFLRRRREWFERITDTIAALRWIAEGHIPPIEEGIERLDRLRAHGPSAQAFTFRDRFPAPTPPVASDVGR